LAAELDHLAQLHMPLGDCLVRILAIERNSDDFEDDVHMYHLNAILSATCRTMENSFLKQNFGGPSIVSPGFLLHFMRTESSGTAVALRAVATCFKVGVSKTTESPLGTSLFVLSDNVRPFFLLNLHGGIFMTFR